MLAYGVISLVLAANCGGAYDPALGTNFGPCAGWQRTADEYQAGDGGGSTADAPAADAAAPAGDAAGDGCPR